MIRKGGSRFSEKIMLKKRQRYGLIQFISDRRGHGTDALLRGSPESSERQSAFHGVNLERGAPNSAPAEAAGRSTHYARSCAGSNCKPEPPRRTCGRTNHILCEADTRRQGVRGHQFDRLGTQGRVPHQVTATEQHLAETQLVCRGRNEPTPPENKRAGLVTVFGDGRTEPVQRDLYSAFLATCCDTNLLDIPQVKIAWASAEPLLRTAMSSVLQPASGKGFAQPHVRNGVRAGRRIKRVGPAVEAGDDVAPLQTETARAPETLPSASLRTPWL
jgi:hypothetical protein